MTHFGTDGIRGIANEDLTPELAFKVGRDSGAALLESYHDDAPLQVLIGRDTRISGLMLENALVAGLLSVGIEVLRLGVISTPAVSYLVKHQGANAGIMITASHNPLEFNGIKFFGSDGYKLPDELEAKIEKNLQLTQDNFPRPLSDRLATVENYTEGSQKYLQFLKQTIPEDLSGLTVYVDSANGSTSSLVPRLYGDMGLEFDTIGTSPNGRNINKEVGSTHPENLQKKVREGKADLGVAFDGDGDRCIAVDEKGNVVDGDKIMYICGKYMADQGKLKKDTVVTTVMSNIGLKKALQTQNLKEIQTKVGDRHVVEELRKHGYNFGGEQSGHIVFLDYTTTGDGLLTSLQLMNIMKKTGKKLSELASEVPIFPQKMDNIKVNNKATILNNDHIKQKVHEVENELGDNGRVLIRPSGTEPLIRVMIEAPTKKEVDKYTKEISNVIKAEI